MKQLRPNLGKPVSIFVRCAIGAALAGQAAGGALELQDCDLAGDGSLSARCGALDVHEAPGDAGSRGLSLNVVLLPATEHHGTADPLFILVGGPGAAATQAAPFYAQAFGEVRKRHELVFMDARGTSATSPLACDLWGDLDDPQTLLDASWYPAEAIRRCLAELKGKADPTLYTTREIVEDLENLRIALGYERIHLWGTSYGTWLAQLYLERHPARVRSMVLKAVIPLGYDWIGNYDENAFWGLGRVFDRCTRDDECHRAFPDLWSQYRRLWTRASRGDLRFSTGEVKSPELLLSAEALAFVTRWNTAAPSVAAFVPLAIHQATEGDASMLGQMALRVRRQAAQRPGPVSWGMHLSVFCSEFLPIFEGQETSPARHGSLLDDGRMSALVEACGIWPRARLPETHWQRRPKETPILLISGGLDASTPPAMADTLLADWSHARHLVIDAVSHSFDNMGPCLDLLVAWSLDPDGRPEPGCARQIEMPAFGLR